MPDLSCREIKSQSAILVPDYRQLNSRENMPAMGRQVYRGWLSNSELRVSGEFCKQGYAVNFDLKQSSVTEIVLAGDVSRQA